MSRTPLPVALFLVVSALPLGVSLTLPGPARAADAPVHTVAVGGSGVVTWPTYDADVARFAVRPDATTDGRLDVTASTTDPGGSIRVDGRPVPSGTPTEVTGLAVGDEVNVSITDAGGTTSQSYIYLPVGFPVLTTTRDDPGQEPGYVFLGLASFLSTKGFETVVDTNGVPVHVRDAQGQDMKASAADAHRYTVARAAPGGGYEIAEVDARFDVVRTHRLATTPGSTDFHDAEMLPGGGALLMGYDADTRNGIDYVDAVIQIVDAQGHATFTWNSKDHIDPAEAYVTGGVGDYAHINSLQMLANGDVLASFRNVSQVKRIATTPHDGHAPGDVIWTLGGAANDFTITDPLGGPCAQHMARLLPNGHLMLFDNGSRYDGAGALGGQTANMCPDPANPDGARIARPQSRVTEYALDEQHHTAELVWSYQSPGRYAAFAGSQQRFADGNTMIGWSYASDEEPPTTTPPIASEVDAAGTELWAIQSQGWFSYRATKYPVADRTLPVARLAVPTDGAVYDQGQPVPADFTCTDRGGSNLQTCAGTERPGAPVDTTPGRHAFTVATTDGAGNTGRTTVHYRVRPTFQPDLWIRRAGHAWRGDDVIGGVTDQRVTLRAPRAGTGGVVRVNLVNDGLQPDRFGVVGSPGTAGYLVRYLLDGTDVTARTVRGTLRTPLLAPGESYRLEVRLRRTVHAAPGSSRTVRVKAVSVTDALRHDAVAATLLAR